MYFQSKLGYTPINYNITMENPPIFDRILPRKKWEIHLQSLIVSLLEEYPRVFVGGITDDWHCLYWIHPQKVCSESLPLKSYRDPKGDYPPGNDHISQPVVRWLPLASFCLARIGWSWRAGNKEVDDHGGFFGFGTCGFLEAAGTDFCCWRVYIYIYISKAIDII